MNWVQRFVAFAHTPSPGFRCSRAGDIFATPDITVPVQHTLMPPATPEQLRTLDCYGSAVKDIRRLLGVANGATLFRALQRPQLQADLGIAEGITLFPIDEWKASTAECLEEWEEQLGPEDTPAYGRGDFVSIGRPEGAWNTLHLVIRGPNCGRVFFWPWSEGGEITSDDYMAESVRDLVDYIVNDPVELLNDLLCCYTRYYDGVSDEQWVPSCYVTGVSSH